MGKIVSIVMPTHNGDKYIRESIESCLAQTYRDIELIVVDDGSTKDMRGIVQSYGDGRIKFLRHEQNLGMARAMNVGFAISVGEYLTWTSDDNRYEPEAIGTMVDLLNTDASADMVFANYYLIGPEGGRLGEVRVGPPEWLYKGNYLGLCFLYRRKVYEKLGGYDPEAFLVEDYEYWTRAYHAGFRIATLDRSLYSFRLHNESLTGRYDREEVLRREQVARDKYIPAYLRYSQHGARAFRKGDIPGARNFLWRSLILNPFNYDTLRLLALIYFPRRVVETIRNFKRKTD
jgi:glycosyltransferase involved in cell wall biosynthesis